MRLLIFLGLFLLTNMVSGQDTGMLKLWYDKPSGDQWEKALPLGNGRIGAMVFGNVEKEIIQLNEHTVWSGSPSRNDNPNALQALPRIRKLINEGKYKEAEKLADENIMTKASNGQMFQPVGNLEFTFDGHDDYIDFYRELNLEEATAKTSYQVGDVRYTREVFTSFSDKVLVLMFTADKQSAISFKVGFNSGHTKKKISINSKKELTLSGVTGDHEGVTGKLGFHSIVKVLNQGGHLIAGGDNLEVRDANSVMVLVTIGTNFNTYNDLGGDEKVRAEEDLAKVIRSGYPRLRATHIAEYKKLFDRVRLDFGESKSSKLPTDARLSNFRKVSDPGFVSLYFQFGRYLLISSSQPGGQPANLQGIWNHRMQPPWDSKYTLNINTQMNYWPAEKTNLSETHEPLIQMVRELAVAGKETAKTMYGARGWVAHHNTDIWRVTGAVDPAFYGLWNAGGAWLTQHLWEKYLYSGDRAYLESVYPVLKGAALFYADFLVEDPATNWLVVSPGNSPENAPKAHEGSSIVSGATMNSQIVFDVFSSVIRASAVLKKDKVFADSLRKMRKKLPPMHIGKYNQLQEWIDDLDDPEDKHRHISHLYGLFPSAQISPYTTPRLFSAARNTLLQRGDVSTGWSMGWKVNWWAKMQEGNRAYKLLQSQLTPLGENQDGGGTYPNLFDAHPPFQIDGNLGCTSGITEMLLQSSDGAIHLLPALPDALSRKGAVSGLRTRGGFDILALEWENGRVSKLVIKSNLGGNLRLRTVTKLALSRGITKMNIARGDNPNPFFYVENIAPVVISSQSDVEPVIVNETMLYDLKTERGITYTFIPAKK